jgi:peroxiredoxin
MKNFLITVISSILVFTVSIAQAKMPSIKDTAVPVNSLVPEISAINIASEPQTIKQLSGKKGLVLVFFRSADWCPYCKRHLLEINQWNKKINDLGYKVAGISYDNVAILKQFSEKNNLEYPLLADQNHKTMEDLKVLNDEQQPGDEHYGIPFPGVMVIDANGKLVYKYFYQGYKKRVKMEQLYKQLKPRK